MFTPPGRLRAGMRPLAFAPAPLSDAPSIPRPPVPARRRRMSRGPSRGDSMRFHPVAAVLIVATFDPGCADTQRPLAPRLAATPSFSMGGAAACPTPATVVVTDEAGLDGAPPAASSGAVIGPRAVFGGRP